MNYNLVNILGINVSNDSKEKLKSRLIANLEKSEKTRIVTPNPEIVLEAQTNEEYFYVLNSADLSLPDGIGLKFAGFMMGKNIKRFTGVELTEFLLEIATEKNYKVLLVNWRGGLSKTDELSGVLKSKFPGLDFMIADTDKTGADLNFKKINEFAPHIIFCNFGAPLQDIFVYKIFDKFPGLVIGVGVGGAFNYYTGKIKPSPWFFKYLGLEWFWRLISLSSFTHKSQRLRRIANAVLVFPAIFVRWRFIQPFLYRKNVACLLFRKNNHKIEFFLVERNNEKEHWQIPQGGTDGMSVLKAGEKELREEIGNNRFQVLASTDFLYKYEFSDFHKKNYRNANMPKHAGFKGQIQALVIAEYEGSDEEIKINYWDHSRWKWVDSHDFIASLHDSRRVAGEIYLNHFNKKAKGF
jgi:N-acetylglucosaminyldiphosphoundecaprenol N-acetyl-beta-D-mannosaminyltransferase